MIEFANEKGLIYCVTDEVGFDNLEDAIDFIGNTASGESDATGWVIDVCKKIEPTHNDFINAKDLIDEMQCKAYSDHSEWSEDYLNDVEYDTEKIKSLNDLLEKWFDENAKQPTFWQAGESVGCFVVDKDILEKYGVEF